MVFLRSGIERRNTQFFKISGCHKTRENISSSRCEVSISRHFFLVQIYLTLTALINDKSYKMLYKKLNRILAFNCLIGMSFVVGSLFHVESGTDLLEVLPGQFFPKSMLSRMGFALASVCSFNGNQHRSSSELVHSLSMMNLASILAQLLFHYILCYYTRL